MASEALRTVALVEDEPDIRAIGRMALEAVGGYEVSEYISGQDALAGLPGNQPDVILLDMMMPGLDGVETFARLRAHATLAAVPVIFMTARVQPEEVVGYMARGAAGVIAKPYDPMTLAADVAKLWSAFHAKAS